MEPPTNGVRSSERPWALIASRKKWYDISVILGDGLADMRSVVDQVTYSVSVLDNAASAPMVRCIVNK